MKWILLSSWMVIFSSSTIYAVLWLVLTYVLVGCYLLYIGWVYVGFLLFIIYIGAINILFLFVVMMIHMKQKEVIYLHDVILGLVIGFMYYWIYSLDSYNYNVFYKLDWWILIYQLFDYQYLAVLLFRDYGIILIWLSLMLLISMLGILWLLVEHKKRIKFQNWSLSCNLIKVMTTYKNRK